MPEMRIPVFGNETVATPTMLLCGSAATLVALWLPIVKTGDFPAKSYSLWDLREVGAPGLPLLVLGAALLVAAGVLLHLTYNRSIPSIWLSCLAIAETLGTLVALSIGFTVTLPDTSDIAFQPGLLLLVAGLTTTLASTQWLSNSTAHQPDSPKG
ncbi:hypothetical protein ACFWPK_16885 [Nocardia sp. NPDC058519]|uniref:hypothetical protein n=1 Tax=Nocardia sp. NPDC058519 TaxID=3346535 RepID=UPI0036690E31